MRKLFIVALCAAGFASFAGCALGVRGSAVPPVTENELLQSLASTGAGKIQHVVYIVQENRSFDDVFYGYPGADTATSGQTSQGQTIDLQPVSLKTVYEVDHSDDAMFDACDGTGKLPGTKCKMDGFNREIQSGGPRNGQYVYVPHSETKPYFAMAHEGVLADRMFASQLDESFVAHQYVISAQAHSSVNVPDGPWGCEGGPEDKVATITHDRREGSGQRACFNDTTLGDELDTAGLSWRFYTSSYSKPLGGFWSAYQAIDHIFNGPDWKKDVIIPQKSFLNDVAHGELARFTWITPLCIDSDHFTCGGGYGPSWVSSLVNAVGKSKFWDSTAIFIQWDDWGGAYDHVPPPHKGYDGLGFRVPLIVLSAYARRGRVSHVQYETASVLRFAEDLFGLKQLSAADRRATSPAGDCFDFSQKPLPFVPIAAPKGPAFFLNQPNDPRIPDEE